MRKLISIEEWLKRQFEAGAPHPATVRRWCANGDVPAQKIGKTWYIELNTNEIELTGNPLVDRVLSA